MLIWSLACHWWVDIFLQWPTLLTFPPHLLKCNWPLHTASLHLRDVMLILCHLEQTLQETHAKSRNNWKKIKGEDWKAFPCLFLCPGARWRYEKGLLLRLLWLEPASPIALEFFVDCFRFCSLITPTDGGNSEERVKALSVPQSVWFSAPGATNFGEHLQHFRQNKLS